MIILYSESKYADGSSIKKISQGFPKQRTIATLWSSPPERFYTSLSIRESISRGFKTSVLKRLEFILSHIYVHKSSFTVPLNFGEIV